jgi:hypothetical protein
LAPMLTVARSDRRTAKCDQVSRGQFWEFRRRLHIDLVEGGDIGVTNKKQTGSAAAKAASKVLRDGRSGKAAKTAAGSALAQAPGGSSKTKKK